jgi:hypothetical protein
LIGFARIAAAFFQDSRDTDLGICLNDLVFETFLDEIMENADF